MVKPYYDRGGITIYHADVADVIESVGPATLVLTDPPYGIGYQSNRRTASPKMPTIHGDASLSAALTVDAIVATQPAAALVFTRWDVLGVWVDAVNQTALTSRSVVVWHKPSGGIGDLKRATLGNHEFIIHATADDFAWPNGRPTDVITVNKDHAAAYVHPTQKPVSLMVWLVERWSRPGDLVFDPFMGSGPVAEACQLLGRRYIGVEIEERYCEYATKRLMQQVFPL